MNKTAQAFRTISEVSEELDVPKHVLRFWEMKFPQIKPMKRGGGRRYYRPEDLDLLNGIRHLLHAEAYTIKGVQKILREKGVDAVKSAPHSGKQDGLTGGGASSRSKSAAKGRAASKTVTAESGGAPATRSRAEQKALPAAAAKAIEHAIAELKSCQALLRQDEQTPASKATTVAAAPGLTRRQA